MALRGFEHSGILMDGTISGILVVSLTAAIGVAAIAAGAGGYITRVATLAERALAIVGSVLMLSGDLTFAAGGRGPAWRGGRLERRTTGMSPPSAWGDTRGRTACIRIDPAEEVRTLGTNVDNVAT
jgi:hypothetical protein